MKREKKQLDLIRKMVIHGLYSVTLKNGYSPDIFKEFKEEQNRLFDNYEANLGLLKKDEVEENKSTESLITKNELLESAKKMAAAGGLHYKKVYEDLCYILGPRYWGYEYQFRKDDEQ